MDIYREYSNLAEDDRQIWLRLASPFWQEGRKPPRPSGAPGVAWVARSFDQWNTGGGFARARDIEIIQRFEREGY